MGQEEKAPERERRDWIIILLLLLLGLLCVILAGGWAIRFAPTWSLDTDMGSNIDPNSDFLTNPPEGYIEPLDPSILTQPAWINVFLTPGASFDTNTPLPTNTSLATNTVPPTAITSPTSTSISPTPTNTSIFIPLPTNTPVPPLPTSTRTPLPSANLAITKDDGNTSYLAGGVLTYTITVTNNGPSAVTGAIVTDSNPAQITTWTWACTAQNGGANGCTAVTNSAANFSDTINLPNGASIVYTVTANVSASATGNLVNTATVAVPSGYSDPVPGNNFATDTDTLTTVSADLSITKDDGVTIVNNGDTVTYTVRVSNSGPGSVTAAILHDPVAAGLNKLSVVCSGTPGQCITPPTIGQLQSGTFALPVLANGQFYELSISANVTASSGSVSNTATVSVPAGVNDPNTGNNSATDTDIFPTTADLQITKTDNATEYVANAIRTYRITVSNAGPDNVTAATVSDVISTNANISGGGWICTPTGGATCQMVGLGDINDTVNLPSGSTITYLYTIQVVGSPSGNLVNTATVTAPVGTTDPLPGNNSATDTNNLIVSVPVGSTNLETTSPPSGAPYQGLSDGDVLTVTLPTPVTVGSHAGWDLIYYEETNGSGIDMDWITIQISNGSNWYTVFSWGDCNSDTNTNVSHALLGISPTNCASEPDNYVIAAGLLINSTGIAIDVDGLSLPAGSYPYVRFIASTGVGPSDGGVNVDGIYVIP